MRVWGVLLLVATAAADPFSPPRERFFGGTTGAYGRYLESLALCKVALEEDPTRVPVLERAIDLLDRFRLADDLTDRVRAALRHTDLEPAQRAALRGLLGRLLVRKASGLGGGVRVVIIGPGGQIRNQDRRLTDEARKLYTEAVAHLRAAIEADPKAVRARNDLAQALDALDSEANADEVRRLRREAAALTLQPAIVRPAPERTERLAVDLRLQAERLEQQPKDPNHAEALLLRKRALVLDFCSHTIPFQYEAPLYGPVSLLCDAHLVQTNLTRSYTNRQGDVERVAPVYYPATTKRKREIVRELAQDRSANAAAVLLRLVVRAQPNDALAVPARDALARGRHDAVAAHLPRLLDHALFLGDAQHYSPRGEQLLVSLAAEFAARDAAPVLRKYLHLDTQLDAPRDIAAALGRLGRPEDAGALLALARDPRADVYFRRQAIRGLGRIEGARLEDVPAEPYLELALAAARYAREPSESLRGRILTGLDELHEADDAARYCAELGIREALPLIDAFLARHEGHYAKEQLLAARESIRSQRKNSPIR